MRIGWWRSRSLRNAEYQLQCQTEQLERERASFARTAEEFAARWEAANERATGHLNSVHRQRQELADLQRTIRALNDEPRPVILEARIYHPDGGSQVIMQWRHDVRYPQEEQIPNLGPHQVSISVRKAL